MSVAVAGMTADPLRHIVVFKTCKVRAKCLEGTLQDANGMDLVEDGSELSAGTYFFTPAGLTGMSSIATM